MHTIIIVAMTSDGLIGAGGRIPWHEPDDLRRFKQTTMGHAIIMGRRTFDSISRALPGRRNIVITRNPAWTATGVDVAPSLEAALQLCRERKEEKAFVIGGAQIYAQALAAADEMLVTYVDAPGISGDTWFPAWNRDEWREVESERHGRLQFVRLCRAGSTS